MDGIAFNIPAQARKFSLPAQTGSGSCAASYSTDTAIEMVQNEAGYWPPSHAKLNSEQYFHYNSYLT